MFINPLGSKQIPKIDRKFKLKSNLRNALESAKMTLETPTLKQNVGNFPLYKKGAAEYIKILNRY